MVHTTPQTMGFKQERKLCARTVTAGPEKQSDKETEPQRPRARRLHSSHRTAGEPSGPLQEVTVKMETMDMQEARLQDLRW